MFWGGWIGYLRHLGSCFGRCWLELGVLGGLLGAFGTKNVQKKKNMTFLAVFGASWEAFWRPCGLQEAILAASWASWAPFLEPLGGFWEHVLVTCCMGCISKNIEKH